MMSVKENFERCITFLNTEHLILSKISLNFGLESRNSFERENYDFSLEMR